MRKVFNFLLTLITLVNLQSCKNEEPSCVNTKSDELKFYSEILNELVEKDFYFFYLNNSENDSGINLSKSEIARLRSIILKDDSKKCILYLDTIMRPKFNNWIYFERSDNDFDIKIRDLIKIFPDINDKTINALNTPFRELNPGDFETCYFRFSSISNYKENTLTCLVGKISLSNAIFNTTNDLALVYYDFTCGGFCGKGELLLSEKTNGRWVIKRRIVMSVS